MKEEEVTLSQRKISQPTMVDALNPIIALTILLGSVVMLYGDAATSSPPRLALILYTIIACLIGQQK